MEGCLPNTVKYALFITNFLVFALGCVVLGFGSYVLITGKDIVDLVDVTGDDSLKIYSSAAILLIVIAVIVVLVTFFGCCGAWKENRCMLGTYFTTILVLFICILVGAVLAVTQDLDFVEDSLTKTMKKYGNAEADDEVITKAWDHVQEDYDCCGVTAFTDWKNATGAIFTDDDGKTDDDFTVPNTCCLGLSTEDKSKCMRRTNNNNADVGYTKGCWTKFSDQIEDNKDEIMYTGIGIIVIMFLNMLCAFALCTMAGR